MKQLRVITIALLVVFLSSNGYAVETTQAPDTEEDSAIEKVDPIEFMIGQRIQLYNGNRWELRMHIKDLQFLPVLPGGVSFKWYHALNNKTISIPVGTEVVWINQDVITSDDKAWFVTAHMMHVRNNDGKVIHMGPVLDKPGSSFSHLFNKPGTFIYACNLHPKKMRGIIQVVNVSPLPLMQLAPGSSITPPDDPEEEEEDEDDES